jgi:two-component system NtrC family sensor kinase
MMDLQSEDARERLISTFRAAQVGRCVSSVTHDINNNLGAIMAYADLLGMNDQLPSDAHRMLDQISSAVQKCSDLVTSLTSIARKERPDASVVDIARLSKQVVELRSYDFRTVQVDLKTTAEDDLPSVVVDPPKMKIALIHLLTNALEAVLESRENEAQPKQETWRGKEQHKSVLLHVARSGNGVEIIISNTAPPVPEESRERIFEPFFTTKPTPHLGLGLPAVKEIIEAHDGELRYDPDRGFIVSLPLNNRLSKLA